MDVIPEGVEDAAASSLRFSSQCGSFVGKWCGEHAVQLHERVDVELDLRGEHTWSEVPPDVPVFEIAGVVNSVVAAVESIDRTVSRPFA